MSGDLLFTGKARPHYFLPGTVWEAALKRVRWVFEEFDGHVSVSSSGGKDSAVTMELARIVARERGELPLHVHFLDQECEYRGTRDYMRWMADDPEIHLDWYQIPIRFYNAASHADEWLHTWDEDLPESEWIRPKEPDSIHVNDFYDGRGRKIDRFKKMLEAINERNGGACLTGMRCEESPNRRVFMTSHASYKWVTWASRGKDGKFYLFHPVYDWSYRDVWHAIEANGWTYNSFYDGMFRHGVTTRSMRVSGFSHEEAIGSLNYLEEIEPDTWAAAARRLKGFNTFAHVGEDQFQDRYTLPYMFSDWDEYFEHLVTKLVPDPENARKFRAQCDRARRELDGIVPVEHIMPAIVGSVLGNDAWGATTEKWIAAQKTPDALAYWARVRKEMAARAFA